MADGTVLAARVRTLAAVWRQWAVTGRDLRPEDWLLPTRCPGWTVAALYAHASGWTATLAGLAPLPADAIPSDTSATALLLRVNAPGRPGDEWDDRIARHAIDRAAATEPEALVAPFDDASRTVAEQLGRLDGDPVVEVPDLATIRLSEAVRVAIMEAFVHLLDLADALGRPLEFPPAALEETTALFFPMCQSVEFVEVATGRAAPSIFPLLR
jgi:uncharacterized protein (TIGR03083 family)